MGPPRGERTSTLSSIICVAARHRRQLRARPCRPRPESRSRVAPRSSVPSRSTRSRHRRRARARPRPRTARDGAATRHGGSRAARPQATTPGRRPLGRRRHQHTRTSARASDRRRAAERRGGGCPHDDLAVVPASTNNEAMPRMSRVARKMRQRCSRSGWHVQRAGTARAIAQSNGVPPGSQSTSVTRSAAAARAPLARASSRRRPRRASSTLTAAATTSGGAADGSCATRSTRRWPGRRGRAPRCGRSGRARPRPRARPRLQRPRAPLAQRNQPRAARRPRRQPARAALRRRAVERSTTWPRSAHAATQALTSSTVAPSSSCAAASASSPAGSSASHPERGPRTGARRGVAGFGGGECMRRCGGEEDARAAPRRVHANAARTQKNREPRACGLYRPIASNASMTKETVARRRVEQSIISKTCPPKRRI